jgi:hypothetical protein
MELSDYVFECELNGHAKHSSESLMKLASLALGVNYRVGPFEITALGLIDTHNIVAVAAVLMDEDGLKRLKEELFKKKEPSRPG